MTMTTAPATASRIPTTLRGQCAELGHAGPATPSTTIAATSTDCSTTHPPPRCPRDGTSAKADEAGAVESGRLDPLDEVGRGRRVDGEGHERLAAFRRPRHGHVRDVHPRLSEHRADLADHSRDVVVREERQVRGELDVDRESERTCAKEPVLGPADGSRNVDVLLVRRHGDPHEV